MRPFLLVATSSALAGLVLGMVGASRIAPVPIDSRTRLEPVACSATAVEPQGRAQREGLPPAPGRREPRSEPRSAPRPPEEGGETEEPAERGQPLHVSVTVHLPDGTCREGMGAVTVLPVLPDAPVAIAEYEVDSSGRLSGPSGPSGPVFR